VMGPSRGMQGQGRAHRRGCRDSDGPAVVPVPAARPEGASARGVGRALPSRVLCLPPGKGHLHQWPRLHIFVNRQLHRRKYWKFSISKDSARHVTWWSRQTRYSNRADSCASSYARVLAEAAVNEFSLLKIPLLVKPFTAPACRPPKAPQSVAAKPSCAAAPIFLKNRDMNRSFINKPQSFKTAHFSNALPPLPDSRFPAWGQGLALGSTP